MIIVDKERIVCDSYTIPCDPRIIIRIFQKNKDVNVKEKEEGQGSEEERNYERHFHGTGKGTIQKLQLQANSI